MYVSSQSYFQVNQEFHATLKRANQITIKKNVSFDLVWESIMKTDTMKKKVLIQMICLTAKSTNNSELYDKPPSFENFMVRRRH